MTPPPTTTRTFVGVEKIVSEATAHLLKPRGKTALVGRLPAPFVATPWLQELYSTTDAHSWAAACHDIVETLDIEKTYLEDR